MLNSRGHQMFPLDAREPSSAYRLNSLLSFLLLVWFVFIFNYQDAFLIPGISPFDASSRKHRRQIPNRRMYPLGRPQRAHLLRYLTVNLRSFVSLIIFDFLAMFLYSLVYQTITSFSFRRAFPVLLKVFRSFGGL